MIRKVKKNVPELRFPDFEGNWKQLTLKEIASKITDGTHDTPTPVSSGFPFLTAIHIKDGYIDFKNCYYLPEGEHRKIFTRCNPEYGDILMVNIGAGTATVARIEVDFEFSLKNVALIKIDQGELSSSFVFQTLSKNSLKLRHQLTSGGAQPFFSLKQISKLAVNLPEKEEQEKIASFLGSIDTRLNQLRRKHELLQTYKRGVMQKLFSQQIRFKDDRGKTFADWEEASLEEITSKIGSGATPRGGEDNYKEFGIALFRSMNVYDNRFQEENLAFIDKNQAKDLDSVSVEEGDILLNITGASIARCCIAPLKFLPARVNQHVMIIRPQRERMNSVFLSNLLVFDEYKNQLFRLGGKGGSTREALTKSHIQDFQILLPCKREQEKIADFLASIDQKIDAISKQIDLTEQFKKGLLQKMFV